MSRANEVKLLLKRGALLAAANWPVVVLQFLADAAFKLLLAVPLITAAFLVAILVGGSAVDLAAADVHEIVAVLLAAFSEHPGAILAWTAGLLGALAGGTALTVLVKGGTVTTLLRADRRTRAIEHRPIRMAVLARASAFELQAFMSGCGRLFKRYFILAVLLGVSYAAAAGVYLMVVYASYQAAATTGVLTAWTFIAAMVSGALVLVVTVVNLLYLLMQIVVAADDVPLAVAARRVMRFLQANAAIVSLLFVTLLVAVTLATAASILATAGLGFIAFIPILGLTIFWLQLAAWGARALLFQYLGLTALLAYAHLYLRTAGERPSERARDTPRAGEQPIAAGAEQAGKTEVGL
ncbi:MAG TPA: hypothetical protein VNK41_03560 [Vicinamibacterales bacterium]|nr:hypothetical protein [Vicinamibacterales bacterium]